jgi:uroporphyrinogen III methyltransferase / synthase
MSGRVYLVGAGPGDPGLLTVRGRALVAEADVVIHDYLVDSRVLRFARRDAEIIPSGKSGDASNRDRQQRTINERMVAAAKGGKVVVRLKGGDPFVFGRGGEEAEALVEAGIPFEVVPGVSSAIAVPAYAGIPVTERGLNSSFTVVTGHEAPGTRHPLDWPSLARTETLVFLMGLKSMREILAELVAAGKRADTPAACVRSGTRPDQQTIVGTLGDLAERVERAALRPPAVVIVGDVVRRRERLRWYENRPLLGRRILVTRAAERADEFVARLEDAGAEAIAAPTIEVEDVDDGGALERAFAAMESFDWIVFTSAHGVEVFFARLFASGADVRSLGRSRLAAIGPATNAALFRRGLRADVVPEEFRAEDLVRALAHSVDGKRVLLPRAEGAREVLPRELGRAGAEVVDVATYRAKPVKALPQRARDLLDRDAVDAITFTSSSTVRNLHSLLGAGAVAKTGRARIAAIGPVTAETARSLGWRVDVEAHDYTAEGLARALIDYFSRGG